MSEDDYPNSGHKRLANETIWDLISVVALVLVLILISILLTWASK